MSSTRCLGAKHLEQAQDLDELALAALGHASLDQATQGGKSYLALLEHKIAALEQAAPLVSSDLPEEANTNRLPDTSSYTR